MSYFAGFLLTWTKIRSNSEYNALNPCRLLNRFVFTGLLFLVSTGLFAQKILLVENQHSFKNYKYYPGDEITYKLVEEEDRNHDIISDMTDSSIVFEMMGEVRLEEITAIFRDNFVVKILQPFTLLAGVAYFGLDSFNRLINNDSPVILAETAIISAGLVAFSFALTPFRQRKLNTSGKWQLRTLNFYEIGPG
jgi:hypothetical protein